MSQSPPASGPARGGAGATDVAALLQRIDARLDRVERALDRAEKLGAQAPGMVAAAVDTLDSLAARVQADGVDIDARVAGMLRLVERLTDPRTERALERLLAAAPLLEKAVDMAEQVPAMVAAAVDTADSLVDRARDAGIDVDERLVVLSRVLERLTAPEALRAVETLLSKLDSLQAMLESGVLDPRAMATVATAGDALVKAASAPASRMGLWGAMRASSDPEVQTALGFLVRFAHAFGADLHDPPSEKRLIEAKVR